MICISLVNMKGGVAKTTLAVNLSHAFVKLASKRVLLIDIDPQFNATQCLVKPETYMKVRAEGRPTAFHIFDDNPPPLVSAVSGPVSQTAMALATIEPWELNCGIHLVPGDLELHNLEGNAGREQRLKRYLEQIHAKDKYDIVIIDTPPTPSHWMQAALIASDYYLVPVKPEPLSRTGIDLLKGVIERYSQNFGLSINGIGVVLTLAEEHTVVFRETVKFLDTNAVWAGKRFTTSLPKRTAIAREQGKQGLILDGDAPHSKSALNAIAKELLERIGLD